MTDDSDTDIRKKIDEIILKNKEKLDIIYRKYINIEKFPLKNKKGDTFFHLRKKADERIVDKSPNNINRIKVDELIIGGKSSDNINQIKADEIIVDKSSDNINQIKADEIIIDGKSSDKIKRKKLRFGKFKKIIEDIQNISKIKPKGTIESKINEIDFSEIDYLKKNKIQDETDEDKEILDNKIIETTENNEFKQKNEDTRETVDNEVDKRLDLSTQEKMGGYKVIKRHSIDPDTIENFLNLIYKYKGKFKILDLVIVDEDKEILDNKIIETTENNEFKQKNEDIGEIIAAELDKRLGLSTQEKMGGYKVIKRHTIDPDNFLNLINKYKGKFKITDLAIADEDKEILDNKIIETTENNEFKQKNEDTRETVDNEVDKRLDLSTQEKMGGYKVIKRHSIDPDTIENFLNLIYKYKGKFKIPDLVIVDEDELDINKLSLKNKEISDIKKPEEIATIKIEDKKINEEKKFEIKTKIKSFFNFSNLKKKKLSDKKTTLSEDSKTEPTKPMSKSVFRVENIPKIEKTDTEEANLIDKKIKESSNYKDQIIEDIGKKEALKLASEHLKNKPPNGDENQTPQIDTDLTSVPKMDEDHEHIFFDEPEASARGWSPQVLDKGRRMAPSSSPGKGELDSEDLKKLGDVELPKDVLQTKSVKLSELGFSEKEWHELDFYSLQEPFAYVEILQEKESLDKCYFFVEMALSQEEEELLRFIEETMSYQDIDPFELEKKNEDEYLLEQLDKIIEEYNIELSKESKNKIYYHMRKTSLGMGKIDPFMRDPHIEDISCDGSGIPVFLYHRKFGSLKSNIRFNDEDQLSSFVFKLAQKCNKHISIAEPMIDATMPDGSRIQMTLSDEVTTKGSTFTIRKFRADPFSPPDLVEFNTMSSEMIAYMWFAIENGVNTLFAGGTASGKTTALNALSLFIPRESKIVSIEETREINLPHPNWIPGVARSGFGEVVADKMIGEIDMYDLMKAALRQRPEYILVGEIRGREAYVLFQAMATGHATYSTVHADSAQSLIHRLEGKPINIPRIMLQSMDIVCLHVITRVKNFRARRCKQVIEIIDIDPTTKEILTNEVFRWDPVDDKFKYSGKSYVLERIRAEKDISRDEITNEIKNRMKLVEWMNKTNIREFREVANVVAHYNEDPNSMLEKVDKEGK